MAALAWRDPVTSCTTIACTSSRRHLGTRITYDNISLYIIICSTLHMIVNYNYINRSISTLSTYVTCLQWGDPLMDLAWFCASACLIVWSGKLARIARIRWYDISWRLVYWLWTKVLKRSKRTPAPAKPKGSEVWLLWSPYCCKKTGFVPYGLRCTKSQTYNWLSISIPEYTRSFNQSILKSINPSIHQPSNQCHVEYC